ncbi:MAG: S8 family serine peptidase [Verrucomicrobia bacterium]|nr:S8 family serine peptidase [Verrucomicrobiota bacterium]
MKTKSNQLLTLAAGAVILLFATASGFAQALPPVGIAPGGPAYLPDELLVQFKANVTDQQLTGAFQQAGLGLIQHLQTPAMKDHGRIGLTHAATAMAVPAAVRLLNNLPGVEFAEPNWVVTPQAEPNDPFYTDGWLWGMYGDDLPFPIGPGGTSNSYGTQAEKAWALGFTGSRDVCVGVIDGGIQVDHPDLAANVWTNPGEIPGNGIDDDGNGYVDDEHGWNAAGNNGMVSYEDVIADTHGTHVAGTIGAVGGNGIGVAGVNWNVTLISGKIFGTNNGTSFGTVQALDYMTTLKTRKGLNLVALNHSWSSGGFSQALLDSFTRAAQAGILSVCSAGNNTNNNDFAPSYPSSFDTTASAGYNAVVSVAAITRDGALATYSNYGQTNVDLGAPGGQYLSATHIPELEILSTVPPSTYDFKRGTSMAAPHVTGAVALYASVHPGTTPQQTRTDLLTAGVRPLGALNGITVTGGTLDIGTLMAVPANTLAAPNAPANVQAVVGAGGRVDLNWADQSANELGFAIERSSGSQPYVLVDTVGANLTSYSDWTVSPNTTYSYRLRAYHAGGSSGYPNSVNVTTPNVGLPAAPASLTASAQTPAKGGGVALAWTDKSNNEGGFQVERKTGSTGTWQPLTTLSANTTKFTDLTTVSRTSYSYRVRGFNIAGSSAYSNQVSVTAK